MLYLKKKIKLKDLKVNISINLENVLITVYSDKKLFVKSDILAKRTKIHTRCVLYMYTLSFSEILQGKKIFDMPLQCMETCRVKLNDNSLQITTQWLSAGVNEGNLINKVTTNLVIIKPTGSCNNDH